MWYNLLVIPFWRWLRTDCLRRTWIEVDLNAIKNNLNLIKDITGKEVFAVVKADAYGHGAERVAAALEESVSHFAVSNIDEAEKLRLAGVTAPILILGYTPKDSVSKLATLNISQCVFSKEYAVALNEYAKQENVNVDVHIKLDTGMGRIGFDCRNDELRGIEEAKDVLKLENLNSVGVFAHFAVADGVSKKDKQFTDGQYKRFVNAVKTLESEGHNFEYCHCGNSAGALSLVLEKTNAVRAGIILYGLTPDTAFPLPKDFKPAMSMYSVVSMVKTIEKGETVSYGRTFKAKSKRKIATVSAGYADGVPRLLSNKGYMLVHGQKAPIVGRVCMDQLCLDVTDIEGVCEGDLVTIFGEGLPVEEIAKTVKTINYEIVCGINKRVPIVYI